MKKEIKIVHQAKDVLKEFIDYIYDENTTYQDLVELKARCAYERVLLKYKG